jgi:hypothetical protein
MSSYRYILQPYKGPKSRYKCPECGKPKSFARYIDTETNEQLNDKVGRCNRESGCGEHYSPKQYFIDNDIPQDENTFRSSKPIIAKPIYFIDQNIFKKSLTGYASNHLISFLTTLFDTDTVKRLTERYQIGSSGHWPGATTFWYVDTLDRVNYGKIMVYNPETGKRDKVKIEHCASVLEKHHANNNSCPPDWLVKYQENDTKINCFFGEHLLKSDPNKPVAIVESEKTALIASIYLPQYIWLAIGSLSYLNVKRCVPLSGRSVTLFPDLGSPGKDGELCLDQDTGIVYKKDNGIWSPTGEVLDIPIDIDKSRFKHFGIEKTKSAYVKWKEKAIELCYKTSDLLENIATSEERQAGLDLADYLIRFKIDDFKKGDEDLDIEPERHSETIEKSSQMEQQGKTPIINPNAVPVHAKYTQAEAAGKLVNHPEAGKINSYWEWVVLYRNRPELQNKYLKLLNEIEL